MSPRHRRTHAGGDLSNGDLSIIANDDSFDDRLNRARVSSFSFARIPVRKGRGGKSSKSNKLRERASETVCDK